MPVDVIRASMDILVECQEAIGYQFKKLDLLRAALTHTSGADTRLASNERLEFLGDAVLGLVTCEQLFMRFPDYQEGDLTKVKSAVVSRRTCARISKLLNLGDFLFLGKGMNLHAVMPANLLADVFESLVAAIYLDGGLDAARPFILKYLGPEIEEVAEGAHAGNFKSLLQQVAQREYNATPQYLLLDEKGPDHSKCFKIAAVIEKHPTFPPAWGRNKKEAEQKAAMNCAGLYRRRVDPLQSRLNGAADADAYVSYLLPPAGLQEPGRLQDRRTLERRPAKRAENLWPVLRRLPARNGFRAPGQAEGLPPRRRRNPRAAWHIPPGTRPTRSKITSSGCA